ncbi:16S rRNA (cytidine(1402)-2'-O)-methyltransferase (EC 2.1.1.198) [uncultured Gammaproteobacteria bacterium]|jgi:16S rRNA (cytidine1402-2'-O)-methyltransferase|uniref:Ribosomal RNA small subunit methyltransferase I n=3 Tax=sulfur-oxidizing symbionts TaxID=32036 RepID=A0A1H6MK31_9GAMM|nr:MULTISPECIES: 16S rRNA (cytidine(1402)-2'-O)-methyltransferase [sulfur-oxidizing symbionts]CAC9492461.1 16S rRNA (cytidine(1402)-2'-O)-methyltransferase (EC 2.1.1.198) [uncultured Gammaproteobacteria bacterium]CAB5494792.1 16S rRNA (cytidine(1402)-2'-O)-methyltransferase (EC [Bathymodiolus azoricus thioautotrophic gill symbiont]CAB5507966.1 16S rRNA (cytidine(1402)-2'-O)-methyltransferase (EC [Bathymodiolus thermophilus thioautotrophic gill symbiont]CAC9510116.1 16S rRNA (cytidine(1402)-2'-O
MPLYIVATPIGNLDDITFRAIATLKNVDVILAEDTRHSKKLLNHYDIDTPMQAFHEHNESAKTTDIVAQLLTGKNIALISDAGTPLISDPGYVLVSEAKKADIEVSPIPGASAMISALSASGIASDHFSFVGFLPAKQTQRLKTIQLNAHLDETLILYESPKRILSCANDLLQVLGDERTVCFAKEISKSFETIKTDILPNLIEYLTEDENHQKGEFVILISGVDKNNKVDGEAQLGKILPILLTEMGASKAAKLAAKITGIDKKHCYQRAIKI